MNNFKDASTQTDPVTITAKKEKVKKEEKEGKKEKEWKEEKEKEEKEEKEKEEEPIKKEKKEPIKRKLLKERFSESANTVIVEIGTDESGRGPMFGRVYAAAVVLPNDGSFDVGMVKDSKLYKKCEKIEEAERYIKENARTWSVVFENEQAIDEMNILQASQQCMRRAILDCVNALTHIEKTTIVLLVDGNYFKSMSYFDTTTHTFRAMEHHCIVGGDNIYASIAAASILAKTARDRYIKELCAEHPILCEHYNIDANKGYGSPSHMEGIKKYGITQWHRKTFGLCKQFC
jgi:ribonuclease HII